MRDVSPAVPPRLSLALVQKTPHTGDGNANDNPIHVCGMLVSTHAFINIISFESQKNFVSQPKNICFPIRVK